MRQIAVDLCVRDRTSLRTARGALLTAGSAVAVCGLLAACTSGSAAKPSSGPASSSPSVPATTSPATASASGATPGTTHASAPTGAVPAPGTGGIHVTVPSRAVRTQSPVPLTSTGHFSSAITTRLQKITPVTGAAHLPGEVSGPALSLRIAIDNGSSKAVDLSGVAVSVLGSGNKPENQLSRNGSTPFTGSLAARAKRTGVYVFTVPVADRSRLTVSISYTAVAPVVLFVGSVR